MNHDLIRLANDMRTCHAQGKPWRLPAMKTQQLARFMRVLDSLGSAERRQLH